MGVSWLRQSTAVTVKIGQFVDDTDGKTPETGLTLSQSDILLSKNGGTLAQKNDTSTCTHDAIGYYSCSLNTTDTNTPGRLKLAVSESGALGLWHDYMVVPQPVYDAIVDGSGYLSVNAIQLSGDTTAADNAESFFDGTGYAGTNNVIPTVTTVTNLTNAPTSGDFTSTMKTSLNAATPASVTGAVGSVTGNVGGNVVGSVASVSGNVGGNVAGSVASVSGNVGGSVVGSVGSVVGTVGSVSGNVGGNVIGSVGSVAGNVGGNVVGSVASVTGGINTGAGVITTLDALDTAQDSQHSTTQAALSTLAGIFAGITSLAQWLGLLAGKQVGNTTARLELNNTGAGGGSYDETTDSLEAIRDGTLDAQAVADALKLAPTAGAPASGSVYNDLDTLRTGVQVSGVDPDAIDDDGISAAAVSKIQAGLSTLTQQNVADALKLAPTAGAPAAGSVYSDTDTLLAGVNVASTNTDAINANSLASSAISEIQSGLSTLTASQAADAVWDELIAGSHDTTNSAGKLLQDAGGLGTPLTAQEVRDAMLLAPTLGSPASGSVDDLLADITADIGGISSITEQEVADALKLAPAAGSPASNSGYDLLNNITTLLGGVSVAPISLVQNPGEWTVHRGDTISQSFTIGNISDRTKLWVTIKYVRSTPDSKAILKVEETAGLVTIAGAAATTPGNAAIVVNNESTGAVTLTVSAAETSKIAQAAKEAVYDWQMLDSGGNVRTMGEGTAVIELDVTQETGL